MYGRNAAKSSVRGRVAANKIAARKNAIPPIHHHFDMCTTYSRSSFGTCGLLNGGS